MNRRLFTAEVTVSGGRDGGTAKSTAGSLTVPLTMPTQLGGPGGEGSNPEELFAAGYAACFLSAMTLVASKAGSDIAGTSVAAKVHLDRSAGGSFALAVELGVTPVGASVEQLREFARIAHEEVCPYSQAIRGNVPVEVTVS